MRITAVELDGFRAFAKAQRFDLDADAVIVVGANGQGKTSLFDGILWALTGRIPRLDSGEHKFVSAYSSSGEARAVLELRSADGRSYRVTRSSDGAQERLRMEVDGSVVREERARVELRELLWEEALVSTDSVAALTAAITRSVYLQQDRVREFVEAESDEARFNAVSELVGAGMVTELQHQLEQSRRAWTRVTSDRLSEEEIANQRLARLESQASKLSGIKQEKGFDIENTWEGWWNQSQALGVTMSKARSPDSVEAPSTLDSAIKQLTALRRAADRRRDLAVELIADLQTQPQPVLEDEGALRGELEAAQRQVDLAQKKLADAEARAAEARRAQVERREAREELRSMAQLALRHLGDRCPVCTQRYDIVGTRRRLEEVVGAAADDEKTVRSVQEEIVEVAAVLERQERAQADVTSRLRQARRAASELRSWSADRGRRLKELGLDPNLEPDSVKEVESLTDTLSKEAAALAAHEEKGERLSLALTQAGERARGDELQLEVARAKKEVEDLEQDVLSRKRTGDLTSRIIEGLREAASEVVAAELERMEQLLQRIYARIDPHPSFRTVNFLTTLARGRGRMATVIGDPTENLSQESPATVLSSSQLNALAVAVFLTLNLGVSKLPLKAALLDDPLQSLDDVNLLGLVDLLRRTKDKRQLIVSTHDVRFGGLLARKLRPVGDDQRTCLIELEGWGRDCPIVKQADVQGDSAPLRIAV